MNMWPSWMLFCFLSLWPSANTKVQISLRVKDGPVRYAGRVEIYHSGIWGSLCDDDLDLNVGHVICRELGYPEAIAVPCCNAFGQGDGPFLLSDVKCKGSESSLVDCEHGEWGKTNCAHKWNDDASVVCKPSNLSVSYPLETRLSYGLVPHAGCVEVNLAGVWGDVWQFHWNRKDGRVVCRQLGYPDIVTVLWRCHKVARPRENVVTWMNNMRCLGNETSLFDCVYEQETYSSSNGFDGGVVCSTGNETGKLQIRLSKEVVSYGGRLEVFLAGIWGVIERSSWDLQDAHVACRQLGFPAAETAIRGATFFFGLSDNQFGWVDDINCVGNESSLSDCPHVISFTAGPVVDAGVVCRTTNNSGIRVRLAGGKSSFAGRVEVWYAGMWGTIRNTGWDLSASNVVCQQLGYREAETTVLYAVGAFGKGQGAVWFSDLCCEGLERTLLNCSWPRVTGVYWDHDHDAGVVCKKNAVSALNQTQVRLMDSSVPRAGRVELSYVGVWGTINGVNWTLQDGLVICRQLGYSSILAAPAFGAFGPGAGPTWLSNVQCLGNESMVSECKHGGWSSLYPVHDTDAAVVCGDNNSTSFTDFELRLVGGSSSNVGRVEVQFGGVWGSVAQVMSLSTFGHVVCRQLGYPAATDVIFDSSSLYGKGTGPLWIAYVSCQGNESKLSDCTYRQVYLSHYLEPGVTCSPVHPTPWGTQSGAGASKEGLTMFLKIGLPIISGLLLIVVIVLFYFRCFRGGRAGYHPRREFMSMGDVSISIENADSKYTHKGVDSACAPEEITSPKADDWCEISRGQISLGEKIRSDSVGVTFRGRVALDNGNTMDCIVKTTTGELELLNDECELLNELRIMGYLGRHPNILNIIGACTIQGPTYLIFEDAEHGNLLDYLHENQISDAVNSSQKSSSLPKVEKLRIALDVARGMKFIAEKKCIHRDLAARNIQLGKNGAAKVANIGILRDIHDRSSYKILSAENLSVKWMAPESLESMRFSTESDVWSFGILLWEIETGGDMPYQEIESENMLDHLKSGFRMKKPANCSDIIYDLMTKCWHICPHERPTFSELCIVLDTLVTRETIC